VTTPITLPATRAVKTDKPRMIDFGGPLKPSLGGPVQNILRLGTRHSIDVTIPSMHAEPDGRTWAAKLRLAKIYGAMMRYYQDGFNPGSPGSPVVNGAGQTGTALALKGFTANYMIKLGQAFSIVTGGRRYLYFAAADTTCSGTGTVTLSIFPMLRKSPANLDVAEFAAPYIQGSITGNELAWDRLTGNVFNFGTITISEDE
jgi:hypothetical protein